MNFARLFAYLVLLSVVVLSATLVAFIQAAAGQPITVEIMWAIIAIIIALIIALIFMFLLFCIARAKDDRKRLLTFLAARLAKTR